MMPFQELFRLLYDRQLRLKTVNRWALSKECEPWLQGLGAWLFDRVVRVPGSDSLFGSSQMGFPGFRDLLLEVSVESFAAGENRIWVLATDRNGSPETRRLMELSEKGTLVSSTSLQSLSVFDHENVPLQLAVLQGNLWLLARSHRTGHDSFLFDVAKQHHLKISGSELEPCSVSAFLDGRGAGFLQFGASLVAHRFAPAFGEFVEWRRRSLNLRFEQCLTRQLLPFGEGWLGILVQPSSWRQQRWLHRIFYLDSRLALKSLTLPFTLGATGRGQCQDFSFSPCGQRVLVICSESDRERSVAHSWAKEKIEAGLIPCSSGQLEFPTPIALKRLRYLAIKS